MQVKLGFPISIWKWRTVLSVVAIVKLLTRVRLFTSPWPAACSFSLFQFKRLHWIVKDWENQMVSFIYFSVVLKPLSPKRWDRQLQSCAVASRVFCAFCWAAKEESFSTLYCLKWSDIRDGVRESFLKLRNKMLRLFFLKNNQTVLSFSVVF